jgi:hypothetical protein
MRFDDQFTPEEQAVIQELRNDSRPKLRPQRVDAIRQQVFAEMDTVFTHPSQPQPPSPISLHTGLIIAIIVIVVVIVIAILIAAPRLTPSSPPSALPGATATSGATLTPESTVSATQVPITSTADPIIVVEGPVQSINANIITIFNINIQVDSNDPILTQIQIGDNLHVEGHAVSQGNTIIIVAINVTIVNEIIVNPASGATALPPNCKITPKGHIRCTKK